MKAKFVNESISLPNPYIFKIRKNKEGEQMVFTPDNRIGGMINSVGTMVLSFQSSYDRDDFKQYCKYNNIKCRKFFGSEDIVVVNSKDFVVENKANEAIQQPFTNNARNQSIRGSYPLSKIQYEDADKKLSAEEIRDLNNWEQHCYKYKYDPKYRKAWDKSVQDIENDAYEVGMSDVDESESYLKEYYDAESDELSKIKMEAKRISKEEGVVQHVNWKGNHYEISDWYDDENTIVSYENGIQL